MFGKTRIWWRNHRDNVVCPINSNIISLINKVIHDYTNVIKKYNKYNWDKSNINFNEQTPRNAWYATLRGESQ